MKLIIKLSIINLLFLTHYSINAQNIGMNPTGANPDPSALVDINATGGPALGILIPRIALTAINAAAPVTSPATSLLVYNTVSANTGTNAVSPGYYYWDGTKWVRFAYNASGSSSTAWDLLGNAGTVDGINFIGTTDNVPFNIKVNNQKAGRIDQAGTTLYGFQAGNSNTVTTNSAFGYRAIFSNTTGYHNTAVGFSALTVNTTGYINTALGSGALGANTTGDNNTATGYNALGSNTTGRQNTANGAIALQSNTTGNNNTAHGAGALAANTTGSDNTVIGLYAASSNNTGSNNTAMGVAALGFNTSGNNNSAFGWNALIANTTGINNVAIGVQAINDNLTGNSNVAMGNSAMYFNITGSQNTAIGTAAMNKNTTGSNNVATGYNALFSNTTGSLNVAVGFHSGYNNTTGLSNTFIGTEAGFGTTTSGGNTAVGYLALNGSNSGSLNSALGFRSLQSNTSGTENLATGYASLFQNTTGLNNTANGAGAMRDNTIGNNNTAVGRAALSINSTGSNNTVIGQRAGATNSVVTTHNNNTFVGAETDATINNLTNATAIGYNAKVGSSNALILGGTGVDAVNVGIGTTTPSRKLSIRGDGIDIFNSANAVIDMQNSSGGNFWRLQAGSAEFVMFDVTNNLPRFNILNNGNVGVGCLTPPTEKLEVQGAVKIVDGTQGLNKVLTSDANGKAHWQESAINTVKYSFSVPFPATVTVASPGNLNTVGPTFSVSTTGIYRVLVDATVPQGMIVGIDNQSLSNAVFYSTVSNRYYAQYFVYITAGSHNLILYNDNNPSLNDGGPYWYFQVEGPIN